jgi:small conductance mechanosensitive channel
VPVRVLSLGDFSVNLRAWAWTQNSADGFVLTCDLTESIKKRFDAEGIEIPFPYRTLVYKNPPVG